MPTCAPDQERVPGAVPGDGDALWSRASLDVSLTQTAASNARMKQNSNPESGLHLLGMLTLPCLSVSCAVVQLRIRRTVFLNRDLSPDRRQVGRYWAPKENTTERESAGNGSASVCKRH